MTTGIATLNNAGVLNMYSPNMNGIFYKNSGDYTYTSAIDTSEMAKTFSIATSLGQASFIQYWSSQIALNSAGITDFDSSQYRQANSILNGGYQTLINTETWSTPLMTPSVSPIQTHVHTFGVPVNNSGGFGFSAFGIDTTTFAVNQKFKSYYIQPNSDGSFIRSATATTLPSVNGQYYSYGTSYGQPTVTYLQPLLINIQFNKGYVNPPLIFITSSSGPISFNYMQKTGGLFTGASIVANGTFQFGGGGTFQGGVAPWGSNTYSFNYFLISEEKPSYIPESQNGIKVFNSGGDEVFNSSYFCPTFLTAETSLPSMKLNGNQYSASNGTGWNIPQFSGVCINNFNAFTGYSRYATDIRIDMPLGGIMTNMYSTFGRYITVTPTSGSPSNVQIFGAGSNAIYAWAYGGFANGGPSPVSNNWNTSYEFVNNASGTTNLLVATYKW
jgi:hypothetical protein